MDEIGYHHSHGPEFLIDRPNGSGDWLFLLTHTPVIVRMNGEDIRVPEPSFIIYTPNCPQYYYTDPDYGKHLDDWIHFGFSKEEEALAHTLGIPFDKPIHLGQATILSKYVRNMCHEFYSTHLHRQETVDLYFKLLLYKLHEQLVLVMPVSEMNETHYGSKLLWIREIIFRNPGKEWDIDQFAADMNLSRSRFQHLYTETFGVSILQDIITSRVHYAAQQLEQTDLSIEQIAGQSGYTSASYFMRQFKAVYQETPNQYRKRKRNI